MLLKGEAALTEKEKQRIIEISNGLYKNMKALLEPKKKGRPYFETARINMEVTQ